MARLLAYGLAPVVMLILGAVSARAFGDEDEPLPAPKAAPNGFVLPGSLGPFPAYYRRSRYDVWQYYAVDRTGHFRARVIYAPYGVAYYLENGQPFPWAETHSLEWMQYVVEH
jgi:hypothetical protein